MDLKYQGIKLMFQKNANSQYLIYRVYKLNVKTRECSIKVYPNQYKKEAINRVLIDDESIREVSIQLGLSNIGTLTRWIKEYKANGYNIIKKKRGRHAHANQEETDIRRIGERECRASPEELARV